MPEARVNSTLAGIVTPLRHHGARLNEDAVAPLYAF